MEDFIQYTTLKFEGELKELDISILKKLAGISEIKIEKQNLIIGYNQLLVSKAVICEMIEKMEIKICNDSAKTGFFSRWTNKLAKSNKKNLGSHRLDCCELKK